MTITFYNSTAEPNRVDKTHFLGNANTVTGQEQPGQSVLHPIIIYESSTEPTYNYAFIATYQRFYFINKKVWLGGNEWELHLDVDVLHTYKQKINNCYAYVDRTESATSTGLLPDDQAYSTAAPKITSTEFTGSELTTEEYVSPGKSGTLVVNYYTLEI